MADAQMADNQVSNDFTASRAALGPATDDSVFQKLLGKGTPQAPATAPASPVTAPPVSTTSPDTPLGLQVDQSGAQPQTEQTFPDKMRALVKDWPVPESGPSMIGTGKDFVEGLADLMEGAHGDLPVGQNLSPKAIGALTVLAPEGSVVPKTIGAARDFIAGLGGKATGATETGAGEAAAAAAPKAAATEEATAAPAAAQAVTTQKGPAFSLAGREGEALEVTPEIKAQARDYLNGVTGDNPVQASLARIADPKVMQEAITGVASFIERDAVKPDELLRMGANAIGMAPQDAIGALRGKLPTDEQIGAWAMLVNSGAKELGSLAQKAIETGAPEDWQAATRAFALQNHVLAEWTAAGTEQGRAFRARQLVWGTRADYTKSVQDIIQNVGSDNVEEAIRKLGSMQSPEQVSGLTGAMRWMTSRDGLLYGWYNYLLSAKTVAAKLTTDALMPVWNTAERYMAEKFGSGAVAPGETGALLSGYLGGFGDAVRAAGRGLMAGRSQFAAEQSTMDGLTKSRLSVLANGGETVDAAASPTYGALAYLRAALPTSWVAGADDFAKTFNYRAQARALSYREGYGQGLDPAALAAKVGGDLNAMPQALHEQAKQYAFQSTFTEPLTGLSEKFSEAMDNFNIPVRGTSFEIPAGRILVPFQRTPTNFLRWMYRASPLPLAFPSAAYKAEIAAGGASRDLAYAKMGLGTGLAMTTAVAATAGYITGGGPTNPQMRRAWLDAGNQPYSVQVPGQRPVSYPVEPFSRTIGAVADAVDLMKFAKPEDNDQLALSLALGMGHAFLSTTYMSQTSNFMNALQHPDTDGGRWVDQLVSSMAVPREAADITGVIDPWVRAHYSLGQTIESKLPFLSQNLPFQRTVWGDKIPLKDAFMPPFSGTGAAHMLSKSTLGPEPGSVEPIDKWIWDNRTAFPQSADGRTGITRPSIVQRYGSGPGVQAEVQLTPYQYDRLQELSGNGVKDQATGLGAKDYLNALIAGTNPNTAMQRQWDKGSPDEQALQVLGTVMKFRSAAKQQMLQEFPDLVDTVQAGWADRARKLQAGPSGPPTVAQQ